MAFKVLQLIKTKPLAARALSAAAAPQELASGARVLQERRPDARVAALSAGLELGARHESEDTSGAVALLVRAQMANNSLARDLKRLGARIQAHVGRDATHVSVTCLPDKQEEALRVLAHVLNGPLAQQDVERARAQLLRDIEARDACPEHVVLDNLHRVAFQGTGLARAPLGRAQSVRALQLKDLDELRETHVSGPRVALAVVSPREVTSDLHALLGALSSKHAPASMPRDEHARFTGSDIRVRDDAVPLATVALAVEGPPRDSRDHVALALLAELFGAWDASFGGGADVSSYLGTCSAVARVTHAFRSLLIGYKDVSLFGIIMTSERLKLEDAAHHVTLEWKRFAQELTDNELARAKNTLLARIHTQQEEPSARANQLATCQPQIAPEHVLSLNARQVRSVAERWLWDRCPAVSAFGPVEQLEDYEVLRSKFYWLRY